MSETIIVVPCYNEAQRLPREVFLDHAKRMGGRVSFIMVNDGSRDETLSVLEGLASESDAFTVLDLPRNGGKAEAVRQGVMAALDRDPEQVGFWDADLATPLDEIEGFVARLDAEPALQVVIGARVRLLGRHIERRRVRHLLGRVFATVASLVLSLPVYDTQCGAKLFRNSPWLRSLFETPFETGWVFDVELIARMGERLDWDLDRLRGMIYEHPLQRWVDVAGSKVRPGDFPKAFFELMSIMAKYRLTRR